MDCAMKKKLIAIVMGLLVSTSVFATGKMGAGLGYKVCSAKEGVGSDILGWALNAVVWPGQPIAILAGSWGAGEGELPANKVMGCGLGYQIFSEKEPTKANQILGWLINEIVWPGQPIAMINGSWGGDDADFAATGKVDVSLAD